MASRAGAERDAGAGEAAEQRESLSIAALHLLERLTPAQRAVFVLRTAFGLPYAEIADALDRSEADCGSCTAARRPASPTARRGARWARPPSDGC